MFILMNTNVQSWGEWQIDTLRSASVRQMGTILISEEAALASTMISSLIMSNKATHRQTAQLLPPHFTHQQQADVDKKKNVIRDKRVVEKKKNHN